MEKNIKDYLYFANLDFKVCSMCVGNNMKEILGSKACEAVEKYLKHVLFIQDDSDISLMHSHNLRALSKSVCKFDQNFPLTLADLGLLGNMYFDFRYPSNSKYEIDDDEERKIFEIVEEIKIYVERYYDTSKNMKSFNN